MSFKRSFNGQNHFNQGFRQARKASLEALEPRQMLSGISFTQDNLVEDNTFQTVFGNELDKDDVSQRYVILNIKSADGSEFDAEDVKIYDSEENEVEIISAKMENGVASILAKYTLGDSYVFVVDSGKETDSEGSDESGDADKGESETEEGTEDLSNMYYVHFTLAGDLDGNATVSREEYYTLQGEVSKGQGVNSRFVAMYKNIYGVDITADNYDTLYDLDGNGKITQNTFDTIIRPNYEDEIKLTQEITVVPEIDDLKVNGKVPSQTLNDEYGFVTNETKDLIFSGSTRAEEVDMTYTTADGVVYSGKIDFTKSGDYTLVNEADEDDAITLTYEILEDGSFTLAFPKDSECSGKIELELWTDVAHSMPSNTYTIYFDTTAPEVYVTEVTVSDVTISESETDEAGIYYVKDEEVTLIAELTAVDSATLETITEALEDSANGIYLSVYDEEGNEIARVPLESDIFSEDEDGNLTIGDAEISVTLEEGAHALTVKVTDLAGNVYDDKSVVVNITLDQTAPTVEVDGYEADYNYETEEDEDPDAMLVSDAALTLTFTVSDANGAASVACKNNDATVTAKEEEDGVWTYDFTLTAGLNTIVVTATDVAGNVTEETYLVYFSEELVLSEAGEALQENGFTETYNGTDTDAQALDLYDYFNYDDGLTFEASSSDTSVVKVSASSSGILSFEYQKTPEEGESLTSTITVIAQNAIGESCTLTFTLNYTYSDAVTFWTETEIENDYASDSLAKVDHIVSQDSITISGNLTVPENSEGVTLNVYHGETLIHEEMNLQEDCEEDGVKYSYDSETSAFSLTLSGLEDGKYTFKVQDVNGKEDEIQETVVYVDTEKPGVGATLETEEFFAGYPEMEVVTTGTATDADKELGLWVEVYLTNTENDSIRYAVAMYDAETGKFSELEYNHDSDWLKDGAYTATVRTVDAAGNVREEENSEKTITIDRVDPIVKIDGYEENYHYQNSEEYDAMQVSEPNLQLTVITSDKTVSTATVTHNGNSVTIQKKENSDGTESDAEEWTANFVLEAGLNTIIFTVVDVAGNETTQTCLVILGDMPKITEDGESLQKYGFTQAVVSGDEAEWKTLDLEYLFECSSEMTFEVSIAENDWVNCEVSEDGILSFDYLKNPNSGKTFSVEVTITATAENGMETELTFTLNYEDDKTAPVWEDLTLLENVASESLADVEYVARNNELYITGRISDASGLKEAYVDVKFGNKTYEKLLLYTENVDYEEDENTEYTADYWFDYDSETGIFEFELYSLGEDSSWLEDGVYSLTFYGTDILGHNTTAKNGAKMENIIVKYEYPDVYGEVNVVPTGTSEDRVNKNPEFTITMDDESAPTLGDLDKEYGLWLQIYAVSDDPENNGENEEGILYAQAKWDNDANSFGELEYLLEETLSDGYWYFRVEAYDVAGNVIFSDGLDIEISAQAPEITANYEENYDSTNYGKYELSGENLDSTYLTNLDTEEDGYYDLGVVISDEGDFTYEMTLRYGENGDETSIEDSYIQLQYGLNIVTVKATNDAGNSATKEFRIWWNDMPTVTEQGTYLENQGFYQVVGEESTWKTLDAKEFFAEGHGLRYDIQGVTEDSRISAEIDAETGVINFSYASTPETDSDGFSADFIITAVDEFGESVKLNFTAYYMYDTQAPKLTEIELEGQPDNIHDENANVLATNKNEIVVSATLHDISEIKEASISVYCGEEKILDALNMLQSSEGVTSKTGISYEYVYSATGNGVTLRLYNADGTPIVEGEYRIEIAGVDDSGNDSVSEDVEKQVLNVLVDRTQLNLNATITLEKTGESETEVNKNPTFTVNVDGLESEAENLWIIVTVKNENGSSDTYAKSKIEANGSYTLTYKEHNLKEGKYTFDFVIEDIAGNKSFSASEEITVDLSIPELISISPTNCESVEGEANEFITYYSSVIRVDAIFEGNANENRYYSFGENGEPTLYNDETGISINAEEINKIYFWGMDTAGNTTEKIDITVKYETKTVTIEDASLSPYDYEEASGTLPKSVKYEEETEVSALVSVGSTLTAGTVVKANSVFSDEVMDALDPNIEEYVDYETTRIDGVRCYTLLKDVEVNVSVTLGKNDTQVNVSKVGANSVLKADSELDGTYMVNFLNIEKVEEIYQNYATTGTPLEMAISAETLGNLEIESVSVQNLPENHAIQSVSLNDDGSLTVKYLPYQVTQDRSPITVELLLKSGEKVNFSLELPYEKPFEIKTTLTDADGASVSEISAEGGTYYLTFSLKCNLPTYSENFVSAYDTCAISDTLTLYVNADAATEITISDFSGDTVTAGKEGDSWNITATPIGSVVGLLGATIQGADGNWITIGSFKMELTGKADLEYRLEQDIQIGFPFEDDETSKTETVGVALGTVNSSQITDAHSETIPVAQTAQVAVASLMTYAMEATSVADTGILPSAVVMENVVRTDALTDSEMEMDSELQSVAEKIAVESYFGDATESVGCTTAVASGIVEESELLSVVQESESVQKAARELTDGLFAEEDFYLNSTEKE